MSTANLDSADLKAVTAGGAIREDVMNQLWDISRIPLPVQDMIGSDSCNNSYTEFFIDELAAPDIDNAVVDGADIAQNDTATGNRVGNHCQTSVKEVQVSTRADASNSIANEGKLAFQVSRRQQELRRDVDATLLYPQASVADDGNTTAGRLGGLQSWIETSYYGGIGGAAGGFNLGTKVVDAPTLGTPRALTETLIRDAAQNVYEEGGDPTVLMSVPGVIRGLSEYMFTDSARIATLMRDKNEDGPGQAQGAVNVFITDFSTLRMQSNRLQQLDTNDAAAVFLLDAEYLRTSFLTGFRVDPLAKTGLSDKRLMHVDYTLKVLNEKAQACIADVDPALPVTT